MISSNLFLIIWGDAPCNSISSIPQACVCDNKCLEKNGYSIVERKEGSMYGGINLENYGINKFDKKRRTKKHRQKDGEIIRLHLKKQSN